MAVKQQPSSTLKTGNNYHNNYTTTNAYVELDFSFPAEKVSFINDSNSDPVQISWNGTNQIYELASAEFVTLSAAGKTSIYVKATAGGEKVRINAE